MTRFAFHLVLGIAMVLARHFAADRGYWIPLTAAIVLKPDFQTTFVRGFARIGGTILGAIIATLVLAALRNNASLEVAGILLATGIAYLTFFPNYAIFTVAITSFVVLVLHMRGLPGTTTIDARLLDTLGGGALAMVGYLVLPSWERQRTRALLADLIEAQRDVAAAILDAYAKPSPDRKRAIARARNAAWQARTAVESSIDRSRQEPNVRTRSVRGARCAFLPRRSASVWRTSRSKRRSMRRWMKRFAARVAAFSRCARGSGWAKSAEALRSQRNGLAKADPLPAATCQD